MCLIGLRWQPGADWPLTVAANRDEFHRRPAAAAGWWPEGLLAGRDLEAGGTWLGVTRDGRFAALTNYRDPGTRRKDVRSRGALPIGFLTGRMSPQAYLESVQAERSAYNDFNLLVGTADDLWWYGSRPDRMQSVPPGVHALSNADLDTPWPKATHLMEGLAGAPDDDALLVLLTDRQRAADDCLPDTGVGLEWERALSSSFIELLDYGTRCSTVLTLSAENGRFTEWTWPDGTRRDFTW